MRTLHATLTLTLLLLAFSAVPAQAERRARGEVVSTVGGLSQARAATAPTADGQLWELSELADAWWEQRGVDACESTVPSIGEPPPEAVRGIAAEHLSQIHGFAEIGSCQWSLTPWLAADTRSHWWGTAQELAYECAIGVHENGHARGLEHDDPRFPIMTEEDIWNEIIPGKCWGWAKKIRNARADAALQVRLREVR